ncbi:unnamed protein product [Alopecurus aequalis]
MMIEWASTSSQVTSKQRNKGALKRLHARLARERPRVDRYCLAFESGGHAPAAVVEDEAEVDGEVELDAEDVGLEHSAEAHGRLEVDEPLQQRAAWQRGRHSHLGLDQAQHVGAHAQLQRVARAPAKRRRGRGWRERRRCRWGGRGWRRAAIPTGAGHGEHHQVHGEEQRDGCLACHC